MTSFWLAVLQVLGPEGWGGVDRPDAKADGQVVPLLPLCGKNVTTAIVIAIVIVMAIIIKRKCRQVICEALAFTL